MARQNMLWCQCIATSKLMELMGFLESLMKLQKKVECQIRMWQSFDLWTIFFETYVFQSICELAFFPCSNSTLQQHFDFGGPIFLNFVSKGVWLVNFWWTMYRLRFLILGLCILVDKGKMQVLITWLWIFGVWLSMSKLGLLIFNDEVQMHMYYLMFRTIMCNTSN
jgi:hypothetical protein